MKRISPLRMTLRLLVPALICVTAVYGVLYYAALAAEKKADFSAEELRIIREGSDRMYLTQERDSLDHQILRRASRDLSDKALQGADYRRLCQRMLATVRSPQQDGVGIAAPQVGINRRVAAIQRYDKPGEPFEVYANLRIERRLGSVQKGGEGCLSYPPYRGEVKRNDSVLVSYTDPQSLERVVELVGGYTAIIFQHECDHLDGYLYIDRADTVYFHPAWDAERAPFVAAGDYAKPLWLEALQQQMLSQ